MPAVGLAMNALSLTIYWVGAAIVNRVSATDLAGRISTFGDIVVFGTYATYIIMSLMMLVMILVLLPMAQVSAVRINEVLDAPISLHEGKMTEAPEQGTVEFRDVSFRYPSSSGDVLEHVSFRANKGETVAFIGATGSGKTTLVSLAARFYDATEGQVLIDGQDVRSYSFDALYDRIGYVTQRAIVFAGDVRSNVLFGESGAPQDDESVQRALSLAQATEFVDKLPGTATWEMIPPNRSLRARSVRACSAWWRDSSSREPKPSSTNIASSRTPPAALCTRSDSPNASDKEALKDSPPDKLFTLRVVPL